MPLGFHTPTGERKKPLAIDAFHILLRAKGSARSSRVLSHGIGSGSLGRGYHPDGRKPGHRAKYAGSFEHFHKVAFSNVAGTLRLFVTMEGLHIGRVAAFGR